MDIDWTHFKAGGPSKRAVLCHAFCSRTATRAQAANFNAYTDETFGTHGKFDWRGVVPAEMSATRRGFFDHVYT